MKVTVFGAAGAVTGSCHLVEAAGKRILLDCGMIQGSKIEEAKNILPFDFDVNYDGGSFWDLQYPEHDDFPKIK